MAWATCCLHLSRSRWMLLPLHGNQCCQLPDRQAPALTPLASPRQSGHMIRERPSKAWQVWYHLVWVSGLCFPHPLHKASETEKERETESQETFTEGRCRGETALPLFSSLFVFTCDLDYMKTEKYCKIIKHPENV